MNVIIMGNFLYPEGMACTKRIQHYIDYLDNKNVTVRLLILRQAETILTDDELEGYSNGIFYKTIGNNIRPGKIFFTALLSYFWSGLQCLNKWKAKSGKNVILCYGPPGVENFMFLCFAKISGYKIIFDIVEDFNSFTGYTHFFRKIKIFFSKPINKLLPILADGIIVISQFLFEKHSTKVGKSTPIKIIPISANVNNNIDKKQFSNPVKIVYSGTFGDKDDLKTLITAFENVSKKNKNIKLLLTGKGEQYNIDRITAAIRNKKGIEYLGYLSNIEFYKFIQEADILCMVRTKSKFANAGFPFKLGEYLATGNPVIASNVGEVEYYLENKKDAVLVAPENSKEIEDAIEYLIKNPANSLQIGNAGRLKCEKFFNPEKNSKILLDLISDLT